MAVFANTPIELINAVYSTLDERLAIGRQRLGRALTLTEKILINHLDDVDGGGMERGVSYTDLRPDRVAMQDATAQMAWLQFMTAGLPRTAVPTTTHCDHLIQARVDGKTDLAVAADTNREVYQFLEDVSAKFGGGFWAPGSGIIHQVVLENYAFPGGMMLGTDSHTPNAGGLGMIAVGVGGADAVDVMTGFPWNVRWPKAIGVHLTGELSGWAAPKDVILKVAEVLTVKGGTGAIVEYFGPGAESMSATGKATICNMGAEIGATTSLFAYDDATSRYLKATGREEIDDAARAVAHHLRADDEVYVNPGDYFDQVIEIDLSTLEPLINGPHTPDLARPVSKLGADAELNGWPKEISAALVGSCTNSSYEDISRAASIARDAAAKGLTAKVPFMVTPGSEATMRTIQRDGFLQDLEAIGGVVLANACGPCIGQWKRDDREGAEGTANTIVTSYNRNFPKRNDGDGATLAFVTSPETVVALALAGTVDFDPKTDTLTNDAGEEVMLTVGAAIELPSAGFEDGTSMFIAPPEDGSDIDISVSPTSDRLQLLSPFPAWDGNDYLELPILGKGMGKVTTDHISMAGPWLKYRGHLENISGNLYLGVVNAYTGESELAIDPSDGQTKTYPDIAKSLHEQGINWVFIGEENVGEGSSREHAAMEPRFRGCHAVFAKSFARIHETNLKKQGVLALTFADSDFWLAIEEGDTISITGLSELAPNRPVDCVLHKVDGESLEFQANQTLSPDQIEWFHAGSALNLIRQQTAG
ncbi:MAG: aconitate hydratase [Acidimicrobiales bacterium]|nr:aconitate hydratase [Acidimicrobiales bacterium]RZV47619.1 MAG: aconitate hydratase [Acidimicrobiales bacterium]